MRSERNDAGATVTVSLEEAKVLDELRAHPEGLANPLFEAGGRVMVQRTLKMLRRLGLVRAWGTTPMWYQAWSVGGWPDEDLALNAFREYLYQYHRDRVDRMIRMLTTKRRKAG